MGATRGDVDLLSRPGLTPTRSRKRARAATSGNQLELAFAPPAFSAALSEQSARAATIWRALLPATALAAWRDRFTPHTDGLLRLEPADQQEEAVAIALGAPRRARAARTPAPPSSPPTARSRSGSPPSSRRYGVVVDNSAGETLADTPPAAFLRLLARAVADGLAPVALLVRPEAPARRLRPRPADCRRAARALERACLRGPAPPPGIAGLRAAGAPRRATLPTFSTASKPASPPCSPSPAAGRDPRRRAPRPDRDRRSRRRRPTPSPAPPGSGRLRRARRSPRTSPPSPPPCPSCRPSPWRILPGLLDATMEGAVVRSRRALRGRDGAEHPRVAILGLLEARLQSFDVVVLGGLAEGVWPPATDPGPWMSRADAHRRRAHLAGGAGRADGARLRHARLRRADRHPLLPAPPRRRARRAGALARAPRRLPRRATAAALAAHPAAHWARLLDQPDGRARHRSQPPRPRPPVAVRPRKLGVTEIETWLRDPYAIYAKHILRLRALDPLEQSADAADYGEIVHNGHRRLGRPRCPPPIRPMPPPGSAARWTARWTSRPAPPGARRLVAPPPGPHRRLAGRHEAERRRQRRRRERRGRGSRPSGRCRTPDFRPARAAPTASSAAPTAAWRCSTTRPAPSRKQKDVEQGYASQLLLEAAMAAGGAFGPASPARRRARLLAPDRRLRRRRDLRALQARTRRHPRPRSTPPRSRSPRLVAAVRRPGAALPLPAPPRRRPALLRLRASSPASPNGRCWRTRHDRPPANAPIGEQLAASDPRVSAFVEASAGSGKTKLLTDRILRLMLAGAPPGRIQCLTFTKAAAAEMALRLQERLGRLGDDRRREARRRAAPSSGRPRRRDARAGARELFAEVLDLPGGMRIGTIHAFCQSPAPPLPARSRDLPAFPARRGRRRPH